MDKFLIDHHGEVLILVLTVLVLLALLVLVPQLLRVTMRKAEMLHLEQMKALENGMTPTREDDRSKVAGRTAILVPMVVVICAGTVTCFLSASNTTSLVAVALTVWVVAGVVGLAAITGGVALIGRLAQIQSTGEDEEEETAKDVPV